MTALIFPSASSVMNRRALGVAVLLASAMVIARDDERLDIPPDVGSLMTDEIYEQAEGWRTPGSGEGWRAPEPQRQPRMHFGFDSAFEEKQMRDTRYQEIRRSSLGETTPNTQFRVDFYPKKNR